VTLAESMLTQTNELAAPLVSLDQVSFTYPNGTQAIGEVSLAVRPGEVVGIVGPSGCGKSSLLSVLAEFGRPTSGSVTWPQGEHSNRHRLSMVFQKDTLLPWLTVEDNVKLFQTMNKRRAVEKADIVDELIGLAGLDDFRKSYPYQLSGGMRRRTAFISAMAATPRLLLLDEPFSSLDEPTRIAIHQDVLNIVHRLDTAVLLVTHDLGEAATLCDRVIVLTARPARIASSHDVQFGPERDVLALRQDPVFLDLYGRLWHDLSEQIERSRASQGEERP